MTKKKWVKTHQCFLHPQQCWDDFERWTIGNYHTSMPSITSSICQCLTWRWFDDLIKLMGFVYYCNYGWMVVVTENKNFEKFMSLLFKTNQHHFYCWMRSWNFPRKILTSDAQCFKGLLKNTSSTTCWRQHWKWQQVF